MKQKSILRIQENRLGWKLMLPSILIIALLIIYPLIYDVYLSFFSIKLSGEKTFVGLSNYGKLLSSARYYRAIFTTTFYLIGTVGGTTALGLLVALLLNLEFKGRNIVRVLVLVPYFAPVISVIFSWQFIFDPVNGIFNEIMVNGLKIWKERVNVINDPNNAVWVVVLFGVWKSFPIAYLMILARLQTINKEMYEAASLDGCGAFSRFRYITLPEIGFVLSTVILLRTIWNLNKFDEVFLLSPNVETMPVYIYNKAFTGIIDQGLAASSTVIQLIIVSVFIYIYIKKIMRW